MRMVWFPRVLTAIAVLFASASAQPLSEAEKKAIGEVLADVGSDELPGYAIGIVRGGEIVFERTRGVALLDHQLPIARDTALNIASNAKQFTALMVLDLATTGAIDLDTDFRTYLTEALPLIGDEITVAHLLTHTSGIRDIYDLWALQGLTWYREPLNNAKARELLDQQQALNFAPGSDYLYSNSNYILLAEMIAAVTGEGFPGYSKAFFAERGMDGTEFRRRSYAVIRKAARSYGNYGSWLEDPGIATMQGDGFLFTPLKDQLHWEQQLQGRGQTLEAGLIANSQGPVPGDLASAYGYGLEFGTMGGLRTIYHVGSTSGANAYVLRFPDEMTSITVMVNSTDIGVVGLGNELARALLGERMSDAGPYPSGPEVIGEKPDLDSVTGPYLSQDGTIIEILRDGDDLKRRIEGRDDVRLLHEEGNVFAYETISDLKMVFDRTPSESGGFTLYLDSQPPASYRKVSRPPTKASDLRRIEGSYVNAETGARIVLAQGEGTAFEMMLNEREREAELVADGVLVSGSYTLDIGPSRRGRGAQSLFLSGGRLRNVRFVRQD